MLALGASWFVLAMLIVVAPFIAPMDPYRTNPRSQLLPPDQEHWLGTDELGRDVLSRLLWGAHFTLSEAFAATLTAVLFGGAIGLVVIANRPWLDQLTAHAIDLMLTVPGLLLALILITVWGRGVWQVGFAVGLALAPVYGRMVRSAALIIRNMDYVKIARAMGASEIWILRRHIIRNLALPLTSYAGQIFAWALINGTALEYLGLGGEPAIPSWGNMINGARPFIERALWLALIPGVAIILCVLALLFLSESTGRISLVER